jgi:hypothetical protein
MSTTPNTQNKAEQLHSAEHFSQKKESSLEIGRAELSAQRVEAVVAERTEILASVRTFLSADLGRAIEIKIQREEKELMKMIDADTQAHEVRLQQSRALDYNFFKKKSLGNTRH